MMFRPSPHRFVVSGSNNDRKPLKAPSRLARQLLSDPSGDAPSSTATSKFSKAPRFVVSTPNSQPQNGPSSTPRLRFSLTQQERREDVQEVLSQSDHEDNGEPVPISVEDDGIDQGHELSHQSPKRRRVEETGRADATGINSRNTPSRFAFTQTQTSNIGDGRPASRPAFLKSSIPAEQPGEPLPDVFSPRKRGRGFVPNGMAAELQSWIFETGNAAVQSRRGQDYLRGEDYAIRIQVHEVSGNGPFFVYAETSDGTPQRVLLVEGSERSGSRATSIRAEDIIGIRAPIWTITVDGKEWTVGVDYKILS
ncbi:hypothetical protein MBLNU457_1574t1 [Dothideomycetes sp. NU457]